MTFVSGQPRSRRSSNLLNDFYRLCFYCSILYCTYETSRPGRLLRLTGPNALGSSTTLGCFLLEQLLLTNRVMWYLRLLSIECCMGLPMIKVFGALMSIQHAILRGNVDCVSFQRFHLRRPWLTSTRVMITFFELFSYSLL